MIWKNKTIKPKKDGLTKIESLILGFLTDSLDSKYGVLIKNQIPYMVKTIRNEYKIDQIAEFYPEKFGIVPEEYLFGRKEEFQLATIFFLLDNKKFKAKIGAVMGCIFDMKISPKLTKAESGQIEFVSIEVADELDENTGRA